MLKLFIPLTFFHLRRWTCWAAHGNAPKTKFSNSLYLLHKFLPVCFWHCWIHALFSFADESLNFQLSSCLSTPLFLSFFLLILIISFVLFLQGHLSSVWKMFYNFTLTIFLFVLRDFVFLASPATISIYFFGSSKQYFHFALLFDFGLLFFHPLFPSKLMRFYSHFLSYSEDSSLSSLATFILFFSLA